MYSFANVGLGDPNESVGVDIAGWVAANIQPHQLFPLAYHSWPGELGNGPILNQSPEEPRAVTINSLTWPRGASRFARGYFVATSQQLAAIRKVTSINGVLASGGFIFADGTNQIATKMWMLPSIPLSKAAPGMNLHLLVLVDDRYWWWGQSIDLAVNVGTTTWANLYSSIGTALNTTILADPVATAYGKPTADYDTGGRPVPMILDAIAFSCGQKITRSLGGVVNAQNVASAVASVTANLAMPMNSYAGGQYDFK
jgi:hypothetical protein